MKPRTNTPTRSARIGARIAPEVLCAIKRAAEITGRSISEFVVAAAHDTAQRVLEKARSVRLSIADQERIAKLLTSPRAPNKALKQAFAAHRKLIRNGCDFGRK